MSLSESQSKSLELTTDLLQEIHGFLISHQEVYEETGFLVDITLKRLNLEDTLAGRIRDICQYGSDEEFDDTTPLQKTRQFESLRRIVGYDSEPPFTLQDHLETIFNIVLSAIVLYYRFECDSEAIKPVTKILSKIKRNYYVNANCPFTTRGCDGFSTLIEVVERVPFAVPGNRPLTYFFNKMLVGLRSWYAHHQMIEGSVNIDKEHVEESARGLYLYDHAGIRRSCEKALAWLQELQGDRHQQEETDFQLQD